MLLVASAAEAQPVSFEVKNDVPAEGFLPLTVLVAALPPLLPLAIEAPCRATADRPPLERARRAHDTLSKLVATATHSPLPRRS